MLPIPGWLVGKKIILNVCEVAIYCCIQVGIPRCISLSFALRKKLLKTSLPNTSRKKAKTFLTHYEV